ncbi:MAG: hypothetical protein DRJ49_00760 [Thermoprotei archaeon]|nr:MAG: hypothetical protein DRN53_02720 [Thermoprotei archaeon]RLE90156.1 MAG: hypothetical protein DRJ49_00760 [Thermoprotei archaeon]
MKTRRVRLGKYLTVKEKYLKPIFSGEKITTIRRGIVVPSSKVVYLRSNGKVVAELEIERVKYVRVEDLTTLDAIKDGFKSKKELLKNLRKCYPNLSDNEWVSIIEFRVVRKIYDEYTHQDTRSPVEIARLGLAYGLPSNEEERRILALIVTIGDLKEVAVRVGGIDKYPLIYKIIGRIERELYKMGILTK